MNAASRLLCLFGCYSLHRGNDVLKLGDLAQSTTGWQPIVLGHGHDERALVRLQAFKEDVEPFSHGRADEMAVKAEGAFKWNSYRTLARQRSRYPQAGC